MALTLKLTERNQIVIEHPAGTVVLRRSSHRHGVEVIAPMEFAILRQPLVRQDSRRKESIPVGS